jgi:hypothetical protein
MMETINRHMEERYIEHVQRRSIKGNDGSGKELIREIQDE